MKRIIIIFLFAVLSFAHKSMAQLYDGITQPTTFRVMIPVTASLQDNGGVSASPILSYRYNPLDWFSVTAVAQYNIGERSFMPQIWLNFNVKQTFYILSRSIYNFKTSRYSHTLSATVKLPRGFMVDCTWDNLFDGRRFCTSDRFQVVAGYAYGKIVGNIGYSMRHKKGIIANIRFKITDYDWIQLKYDGGMNAVTMQFFIQFN